MSPVAGFVRTRAHQFGRQASLGTPVAAKRRYAFKGVPSVDPRWTDPDVDTGSIDPSQAPHREAGDFTIPLTDPALRYNTIPLLMCGFFGGGVTPSGVGDAKTWVHTPSSIAADPNDLFTYEFGNTDVTSDWYQMYDAIIETLEITGTGKGALSVSHTWRAGGVNGSGFTDYPDSPTVPTSLVLAKNEAVVYMKDLGLYIASDYDDIETGLISAAWHGFRLRLTKTVDQKHWADGDQSFDIDEYGVSARAIELEGTFSKTADIVGTGSESDAWFSASPVDRFMRLDAISTEIAETGTPDVPYSWQLDMPARYYTRSEAEQGGNATVVLNAHAFLDEVDFDGVFKSTAVTTLANAGL